MKQLTKKQLNEQVQVTCYGKTETMRRKDAIDKFYEGARCCDGCESERYFNIYQQLMDGEMHAYDDPPQVTERCPHCGEEVDLDAVFEPQLCPNCMNVFLPCSLCDTDKVKCSECPLESLRKEIEAKIKKYFPHRYKAS